MKTTSMSKTEEEIKFAKDAAMCFANKPEIFSYSGVGGIMKGELLALRWGLFDRSVLVLRISDDDEPTVYRDLTYDALVKKEK